jgi:hypothetical protein
VRRKTLLLVLAVVVVIAMLVALNADRLFDALLRMHGVQGGHGSH